MNFKRKHFRSSKPTLLDLDWNAIRKTLRSDALRCDYVIFATIS